MEIKCIKLKFLFFLTHCLIFGHVKADYRIDPLVYTNVGLIRGVKATDGDYSMFMGIPYGKVNPANPFGLSEPYPPFEEVFEANDDAAVCPQIDDDTNLIIGTIDCLHLNVYVPTSASSKNLLPVMVWFHGGAFSVGHAKKSLYGPKYLVRHDIILITLNYRLGPYGFMCLDIPEVPGNQGLKDQLLALRWVKEHIGSFGGDVNKITIFGESAGGVSVDLHLYSAQEKLFNRVILQSGTALLRDLDTESNSHLLLKLSELLGLNTSNITQALSFVSSIDPKLVIAAASKVDSFYTCIEKDFENVEKFYVDYPYKSNIPKANGMSMLIGYNTDEYLWKHANQNAEFYEKYNGFYEFLDKNFVMNEDHRNKMADVLRQYYVGDKKINEDVMFRLSEFKSDYWFTYPVSRTINKYIENGADKVFQYVFSHVGQRNWIRTTYNISVGGATHADEIGYLFDVSQLFTDEPTDIDQLVIDSITTLWTNFAKYGDPTPETTDLLPIKWKPITSKDSPHYYLNIASALTLGKRPFHDRVAFWELFYNINEKYLKDFSNKQSSND